MILGWEVHNQGWIRDFSLRSPLCPFFPAASTHLFLSEPETREELPRSRPGRSITRSSPRPLPRVKPEYDPISCKAGWSDAVSKERTAGGNGEARGRKEERPRRGMSGLRGQRRVRHAPGAAESRSTEVQGPRGVTLLRLREPGPGTRKE